MITNMTPLADRIAALSPDFKPAGRLLSRKRSGGREVGQFAGPFFEATMIIEPARRHGEYAWSVDVKMPDGQSSRKAGVTVGRGAADALADNALLREIVLWGEVLTRAQLCRAERAPVALTLTAPRKLSILERIKRLLP